MTMLLGIKLLSSKILRSIPPILPKKHFLRFKSTNKELEELANIINLLNKQVVFIKQKILFPLIL